MFPRLFLFAALSLAVALTFGNVGVAAAEGEASGLSVESQTCSDGFTVQVVLSWTPSGAGEQWVDFSLRNDGFTEPYVHGGPFSATQSQATLHNLEPQRNYYVRVATSVDGGWAYSDLYAFLTGCQAFEVTPPTHVAGASVSDTAARLSWIAGNGNLWYCVDYASTPEDLTGMTGTWRNSGCGTTATTHVIEGMLCDQEYVARVWAWTTDGGRYSPQVKVHTQACASTITEATELRTLFASTDRARVAWRPGSNNIWYCVDIAENLGDLQKYTGTWQNFCGLTEPELELRRLDCETDYAWRVYTWNFKASAHSIARYFKTADCDLEDELAPIIEVEVHKSEGDVYRAEVLVALPNGCHMPGFYRVSRAGNKVELTVENLVEVPLTVCSAVTGTHLWTIRLGSGFSQGVTYEVEVNGGSSVFFTPG